MSDSDSLPPWGVENGRAFGRMVCEALGINPRFVRRVTIVSDAKDVLRVTVDCYSKLSEAPEVTAMLRSLVEANPDVTINYTRPVYDLTNMASAAKEIGE
jgi:hypothetical protein